ncbi:MAG TPA: hypothetical protein VFY56_03425 [Propionibacteriaceae bacterium]|nr:hypothetical protein [Propionibacteriaceae bacterium]
MKGDGRHARKRMRQPGLRSLVILINARPLGVVMDRIGQAPPDLLSAGGRSRAVDAADLGIAMAIWCVP